MLSAALHHRIRFFLCCIVAFTLPFKKPVPVFIILLCLNFLLEGNVAARFSILRSRKIFFPFFAFYALMLLTLLWSVNVSAGLEKLQTQLSLLVFPLVFAVSNISIEEVKRIAVFFVYGCFLASLVSLCLFITGNQEKNLHDVFSRFLHPSYFAVYIIMACVFLMCYREKNHSKILFVFLLTWFVMVVLALGSRLGYLVLGILFLAWGLKLVLEQKKYRMAVLVLLLLAGGYYLAYRVSTYNQQRAAETFHALSHLNELKPGDGESASVRLQIWQTCIELAAQKPLFGHGTGSSQTILDSAYQQKKLHVPLVLHLNAHNQYLQVLISYGYTGLLLFVFMLGWPLWVAYRKRMIVYTFFSLATLMFFVTESVFETEAGTMYYGFFNALLMVGCLYPAMEK